MHNTNFSSRKDSLIRYTLLNLRVYLKTMDLKVVVGKVLREHHTSAGSQINIHEFKESLIYLFGTQSERARGAISQFWINLNFAGQNEQRSVALGNERASNRIEGYNWLPPSEYGHNRQSQIDQIWALKRCVKPSPEDPNIQFHFH